jgi:hypothetical protein
LAVTAPNKPIIVGETGSSAVGGNQAKWVTDGYPAVYTKWPKIKGIVYFNLNMHYVDQPDWRLKNRSSTEETLNAYKALLTQTKFQGKIP